MLHLEFAVAPHEVNSLHHLSLLEARMGFEKGALLSRFPNGWFRQVSENLRQKNCSSKIDRTTEKLRQIKNCKLVGLQREYSGEDWAQAAQNSHTDSPFHRVIEKSLNGPPHLIPSIEDLEDSDFVFVSQYQRSAQALARAAKALLNGAEKVTMFDPYLCPTKTSCLTTLIECMNLCRKAEVEFHIFSEEDGKPDWQTRRDSLSAFQHKIPENIRLFWYSVDDHGSGFLHSRGLFTSKGGLIYDRGFEEPRDLTQRDEVTDVTPMPIGYLTEKARVFNTAQQYERFTMVQMYVHQEL
ncbi:hypothetical protein EYS14_12560 [Alteromonadaceae bacterium M269]|nr:hypothetical protein EYS14_12560 [Alteromonadaceae bacterium M269]